MAKKRLRLVPTSTVMRRRPSRSLTAITALAKQPESLIRVRPRFDCLIEKVLVRAGQNVKKGDALVELFSIDMAAAKNDYLTKEVQWKNDQRILELRHELFKNKAISQQLWVDTQNSD